MTAIAITNRATDSDIPTNSLSYTLVSPPVGMTINTNSAVITWTPTEAQGPSTNLITTVVKDNGVPPLSATNTFTLIITEVNSAPVLSVISTRTNAELTAFIFTNSATDADIPTNRLSYLLLSPPAGMSINTNSAVITWTPTETQGPSTNLITTIATDNGVPPLSATNSFTLIITEVNSAPVLPFIADQTIPELTTLIVTNTATDSDIPTNTLSYSLLSAPSGAVIDAASGIISWAPSESQGPSTNLITTVVTDNGVPPLSATNTFTVIVTEVNSAPTLAPISDLATYAGIPLAITNAATDSDIPTNTLSFSLTLAPTGATIDAASGLIAWTPPAAAATNLFTVRVTDDGTPPLAAEISFAVSVLFPSLQIGGDPSQMLLNWPADATPFILESSTDLYDIASWQPVTNPPSTNGILLQITNAPAFDREFFRLRLP